MEYAVGLELAQQRFNAGAIGDIGFHERSAGGQFVALAVAKVVEHRDRVTSLHQDGGDGTADVAGAAGDEDVHAFS